MVIRPLGQQDKNAFVRLVGQFYSLPAVAHAIPPQHAVDTFETILSGSPYAKGYLFEQDGKTAGYALLALTWSNEAGGLCVWIEELFIKEEFRGQGIGGEFFAWLLKEFSNARRFRLEATEENEGAVRLYRRLGYEFLEYRQMVFDRPDGCKP